MTAARDSRPREHQLYLPLSSVLSTPSWEPPLSHGSHALGGSGGGRLPKTSAGPLIMRRLGEADEPPMEGSFSRVWVKLLQNYLKSL